jgi:hypothetical protein
MQTVTPMGGSRTTLWLLWAAIVALLALDAIAVTRFLPVRAHPWYDAQTSVALLVLGLLALVAGVGTFALRESLVLRDLRSGTLDPNTASGFARIQRTLVALWSLCLVIGLFGNVLAWGAATPIVAAPFLIAAVVLLVVHAPRGWLFARAAGTARA